MSTYLVERIYTIEIMDGDLNLDGNVDMEDAIKAIQVMIGIDALQDVNMDAEINDDGRIGLEEVIYILQEVSGLR